MNNVLQFDFSWENPLGAVSPELAATWAHLIIRIDGAIITQVHDYGAQSVRDGIYLPLYPLAEWLALHWWPLLCEPEAPRRSVYRDYPRRHNLRFAREGFALPHLQLTPFDGSIRFEWRSADLPACGVRFLHDGMAILDAEVVKQALTRLIESVIARLAIREVKQTLLQEEWAVILATAPEEGQFCRMAGMLGQDPYSLNAGEQDIIIQTVETLPESLLDDFFTIADFNELDAQSQRVQRGLELASNQSVVLTPLQELRNRLRGIDPRNKIWAEGYAFARQLRQELGLQDRTARSVDELGALFQIDSGALRSAIVNWRGTERVCEPTVREKPGFFDALVGINAQGSPGFLLDKSLETSKVFALSRAFFEYLRIPSNRPILISGAMTEEQKRNRAFAAEFLAPSVMLKERVRSDFLDMEDVDELAMQFGVSPFVIRYQLENHHLARIIES